MLNGIAVRTAITKYLNQNDEVILKKKKNNKNYFLFFKPTQT